MSPTKGLHAKVLNTYIYIAVSPLFSSEMVLVKDLVSLNPSFPSSCSVLIGQMAQSIVIGLLCSDWSDGPVYCDWFTLF